MVVCFNNDNNNSNNDNSRNTYIYDVLDLQFWNFKFNEDICLDVLMLMCVIIFIYY